MSVNDRKKADDEQGEAALHEQGNWKSDGFEEIVSERTAELTRLNNELRKEIADRKRAEEQLVQHTQLLSTLLDVSNLVSSTMQLKPFLESILDRLKTIINYKVARVFVIEKDALRVVAYRCELASGADPDNFFSSGHTSISRTVITTKKPLVISDIMENTDAACELRQFMSTHHDMHLQSMCSWLGLPLLIKDRVIGILTIDHDEPGYYNSQHAEVGMAFANQAAIEFENARLYNETQKKTDELKTMLAVQQAIASRLELDGVLRIIADEMRRLTGAGRAVVFLVEEDELVLSAFSGQDSEKFLGYRIPIDSSAAGKILLSHKPLMVNDAAKDPEVYRGLLEDAGARSFLCVPLMLGSKPIGLLGAADKLASGFNEEDERIITMLSSIAAIGIENARMYQEEKHRHQEDEQHRYVAEGLRDILAILNSNRPLDETLEFIINHAAKFMRTDIGALYRLEKDDAVLTIKASCGLPEELLLRNSIPVNVNIINHVIHEHKLITIKDIRNITSYADNISAELQQHLTQLSSLCMGLLAVPIMCKSNIYGYIVLYFKQPRDFIKNETDLAAIFADQAALAIDNASLRAQAEEAAVAAERSRLARDLHDAVTQTLFSAGLIAEVLPKIWTKNQEEGKKRLEELRQLSRGALAEMRTLLMELRPASLVEAKLGDLLRQLSEATIGRARIPVTLNIEKYSELPTDVKIAFYRIAQEALNNIAKHSGASQVVILLKNVWLGQDTDETVQLSINDNGRGFDIGQLPPGHFGVGIMHERAEAAGAEFHIQSAAGQGTEIHVSWKQ